ncbi:hypothetical protein ACE2AJ_11610 [Aquihabitans daechungensis]|uniref:hypothetical protein n=1 Tax=Aquihabitans daechungensis TaxID=1052257 RepID=UPI003B9E8580
MFLFGMFLQVRIFDRSILLPFFAIAGVTYLHRLAAYGAFSRSPWFATARACGSLIVALGFAAWLPHPVGGTAGSLCGAAVFAGAAAYAGALGDWSARQGWVETEVKARAAVRWLLASIGIAAVALLVHLVLSDPGRARADSTYQPDTVFGRPLEGWGPGIAFILIAGASIVGLLKLRSTSQLIRHSLRAQPDPPLVEV